VPLNLPNETGYFDTLVADTVFTGGSNYNIAFSRNGQLFFSRPYSNGSSHVSIQGNSQFTLLASQVALLSSTPSIPTAIFVISIVAPVSVYIQDLKLTFTPVSTAIADSSVPWQTGLVLLFAELMLVFGLPA